MRLFILLPFAPRLDAAHGGGRVIADFLTRVIARHQVAVLYFRRSDEPSADEFFRQRCTLLEEVTLPISKNTPFHRFLRYLEVIASLIRLQPLWVADWSSQEFARQVDLIVQKFRPDIIQAEYHVMGQYLFRVPDLPRVLVQYEPGVRAAPFIKNLPAILNGIVHRIENFAWRRYEARLYRQVNAIVVFTEADQTAVKEITGPTPVYLIPPGTAVPELPLHPLGDPTLNLLFFGNFVHPPNVDAARRLILSIFPVVQRCFPEIKLFIVGAHPPDELKRMSSEKIVITGRVPDIIPYLDRASLLVAPLYQGGGIRIKVLEALAAGKAVVTTPLAAQGLNLIDGQQIALAQSDHEIAERIVHLLEDPKERASIAARARGWACANLGWDQNIDRYEALWQGLDSDG